MHDSSAGTALARLPSSRHILLQQMLWGGGELSKRVLLCSHYCHLHLDAQSESHLNALATELGPLWHTGLAQEKRRMEEG